MYWAHSDPRGLTPDTLGSRWQPLSGHLLEVGKLAFELSLHAGASAGFAHRAKAAGLLHDLGKYSQRFQMLLRGEVTKAPHSIYGAALAVKLGGAADIGFAVAGHHAGMPDRSNLREAVAVNSEEAQSIWVDALKAFPNLSQMLDESFAVGKSALPRDALQFELQTRMLLSILVDADRRNTAFAAGEPEVLPKKLNAALLLERLLAQVQVRAGRCAEGAVKQARRDILNSCLAAANRKGPLFSLTVPTGGGKTFSSMAFALRRAQLDSSIRRIVIVVPFLSIIEQNAAAYREAFEDDVILEHHSAAQESADTEGEYRSPFGRVAYENWDAPIVITTSVRFFESLFSNHPRDVRRMASLAQSIVILDEIQTLPRAYVSCTLSLINGLASHWGTSFVFCTATQPALETSSTATGPDPRFPSGTLDEIVPDPPLLFARLQRVTTEWRKEKLSWGQIAEEMTRQPQALAIVNTRRAAAELYAELRRCSAAALHLSNQMCPAHRLLRLAEVRRRVAANEPCHLAATQLVEAGVDIDFPMVWRALAPLDSIAQAAGRCDREGRLTQMAGRPAGKLVVFEPVEDSMPPEVYKEGAAITRMMLAAGDVSWADPNTIRRYFDELYHKGAALDPAGIEMLRKEFQFKSVSNLVQWIDDRSEPVLVPFDDQARELARQIPFSGFGLAQIRRAQKYTVNVPPHVLRRGMAIGSIYRLVDGVDYFALREGLYSDEQGIQIEGSDGIV